MENAPEKKYDEWAGLLWEEYKYRHDLYWKSIYLWGGAATAIFIAPFLKPELEILRSAIFIFPVVGLAISLIGAWHLASESERLGVVVAKYNQIRGENYSPPWVYKDKRTWYQQAVTESTGKAVTVLFTFGFSVFFILDVLFLIILLNPDRWLLPFVTGIFLVVITGLRLIALVEKRRQEHNTSIKQT
jgi:hypothetical protein